MKESSYKKISKELFLTEISYNEYKNDPSKTSRKKINEAIQRINGMMGLIERTLKQNIKLRNETVSDHSKLMWKSTESRLHKMHERLNNIFTLLHEIKTKKLE